MVPVRGSLLVSEPSLDDPHFNHSVVLMLDYDAEGESIGVVLNRDTSALLSQAIDGVRLGHDASVFAGGPVGTDRLLFIHALGGIISDSKEIAPGLYLGGNVEDAIEYVNDGYPVDGAIRFFIGYSGWSKGQLDEEIASGSWIVTSSELSSDVLLSQSGSHLWHTVVKGLGDDFNSWRLSPMHPHFN